MCAGIGALLGALAGPIGAAAGGLIGGTAYVVKSGEYQQAAY